MRDIKFWLIIALVLALVISILTRPTKEITDLTPYKTALAIADQQIDSLTRSNRATIKRIQEDSIIQAEERESFKTKLNAISRRQNTRRPQVLEQIDSLPIVKAFIETQDSVISLQAVRIDTLQNNLSELRINLSQIQNNFLKQIEQHEVKLKSTEALVDAYKKENRSERRKRKIATALIPVAAVGMFLLAQ